MASPTDPTAPTPTPVDQATIDSWSDWDAKITTANSDLDSFGVMNERVGTFLGGLSNRLENAGVKLSNLGTLLSEDSAKFGTITTAILGATESFKGFAGVDTSRLNTFSSQMNDLIRMLSTPGTATGALTKGTKDLVNQLMQIGRPLSEINQALKAGVSGLVSYASNVLISADNTLRLQNSMIQLAAQAGDIETLYKGVGDTFVGLGQGLETVNDATVQFEKVMFDAMKATNIQDVEVMFNFISQLTKLPGGLAAVTGSINVAGRPISILTAAIQLATGAGREQADVFADMGQAMAEFGASAETALRFTARISEISGTLNAQIKDVRDALMSSADAFKMFVFGEADATKMTQGMSDAMENYVGQLKSVGVPVQNALGMFKNFTETMKGMTQAQEAFISAQSGGPGGLRGGFQIDAMIQRGDFEGLRQRVEQTIKRMTGPIVSLEEAQQSEGAAARFTRQIQILQQGPLGGQARTRPEAEALLEAMRRGTRPEIRAQDNLQKTIERGQNIEQLSLTKLSEIAINTQGLRALAGAANLTTLQRAAAARTGAAGGAGGAGAGINTENQEALRAFQRTGGGGTPGGMAAEAFRDMGRTIETLPTAVSGAIGSVRESIRGTNEPTAGRRVGQAAALQAARTPTGGGPAGATVAPTGLATPGGPVPVTLSPGSAITVNFTGVCPHCGRGMHGSEQTNIQSTASTQPR